VGHCYDVVRHGINNVNTEQYHVLGCDGMWLSHSDWCLLSISSALKIDAVYSSEKSVSLYQTTWRHIPECSTFDRQHCKNLRSSELNILCVEVCLFHSLDDTPFICILLRLMSLGCDTV
jgi:hypothetical protein